MIKNNFSKIIYTREKTREVKIGNLKIGGSAPISVQSMTNTDTKKVEDTVKQIKNMEEAGCELVRVAVPNLEVCSVLPLIRKQINIPLVADVHFNYQIVLKCIELGIDGVRINPGNIKDKEQLKSIIKKAKEKEIPIRFGINSGSLDPIITKKYTRITAYSLLESANKVIKILEEMNYHNIIFSLKSSSVMDTINANILFAQQYSYPLHIGITEAGPYFSGVIKSSVGIGILLYLGLGNTIRVSITDDPVKEVKVGYEILKSLNLRKRGPQIISCPTCARCQVNLKKIVEDIEERTKNLKKSITIAVMGCVVNGPGEAREADIGIAYHKNIAVIFKNGEVVGKFSEKEIIDILFLEIEKMSSK